MFMEFSEKLFLESDTKLLPGVPEKMIHKIQVFFKNSPSPNGIKSYRLNASVFGELTPIN